jgi:hypothetical protein
MQVAVPVDLVLDAVVSFSQRKAIKIEEDRRLNAPASAELSRHPGLDTIIQKLRRIVSLVIIIPGFRVAIARRRRKV